MKDSVAGLPPQRTDARSGHRQICLFRIRIWHWGSRQCRVTLWIAACAMVLSSAGCAHRSKTPPTVAEIANPVRRDLPVYSEWIDATVSYIDSHIHVSRDRRPHSNGGGSRAGQRAVCPACMRNSRRVDRFQAWLLYFWCRPRTVSFIAKTFVMTKSNPDRVR